MESKALNKIQKEQDRVEEYRRQTLKELYLRLHPNQKEIFNKMYVNVDNVTGEQINWAIKQCERTIQANKDRAKVKYKC